jgi:hypothetical protein
MCLLKKIALLSLLVIAFSIVINKRASQSVYTSGYIGISLPADFQAFNKQSPWNTPIPDKTVTDPYSEAMMSNLIKKVKIIRGNIMGWTVPLFVIDSKASPKRDLRTTGDHFNEEIDPLDTKVAKGIPIPEGVWPDPMTDGHMLLVDPKARKSWDFNRAKHLPDGTWTTSGVNIWDLDGPGYRKPFSGKYWWDFGSRGSGFPLLAGLIRPEEIEAGEIRHALVFSTPINRKTSTPGVRWEVCSPPAYKTDGEGIGKEFIPEGARIQLDPKLDLDSLHLSHATKVIARAMQKYGMYNGDNGADLSIYFQNLGPDGGAWKKYHYFRDLERIPLNRFRVIKCTIATK